MNIDLMISADHINAYKLEGKTVIVIDVLRATSVIVTAIKNGCKEVIPVLSTEEAFDLCKKDRALYILGGERNALKIEGFNCSNSPLDYTEEVIKNKTFIITTSNGTRAIKGSKRARNILIGAMINAEAVAKKVCAINNDLVIVNSGTNGEFSMDDFICGGYIISKIKEINKKINLTDIAKTSYMVYENHKDIISFIKDATHYNRLTRLRSEDDLEYCIQKDIIDIVPEYKDGKIK